MAAALPPIQPTQPPPCRNLAGSRAHPRESRRSSRQSFSLLAIKNRKRQETPLKTIGNNGILRIRKNPTPNGERTMPKKKPPQAPQQEWTQRAKPRKESPRTRRIALIFSPQQADRLILLARLNGVSVNHQVELMTDAEYSARLADPKTKALIKALAKQSEANQ